MTKATEVSRQSHGHFRLGRPSSKGIEGEPVRVKQIFNLGDPAVRRSTSAKRSAGRSASRGWRQLRGGPFKGEIAGHIFVNILQGNIGEYDPYATPRVGRHPRSEDGDIPVGARHERRRGGDDPVCQNVLTISGPEDPCPEQTTLLDETSTCPTEAHRI